MPTVYVIGSANMDLVVRTPRIPKPGETILGSHFQTHPGGKGANQAVAAARMGAEVRFVGRVGDDVFGQALSQSLQRAGVDTRHLTTDPEHPSGIATITVEDSGQNAIVVAPGANGQLSPAHVQAALREAQPGDVVLTQLEIPLPAVEAALTEGPPDLVRILNPAPAIPFPSAWLPRIHILTPNEHEAGLIAGEAEHDEDTIAARLLGMGVQTLLMTLGARGVLRADADGHRIIPSIRVKAVDTTAAGDAFNGGLAAFLAEGMNLSDAVAKANRVGALCATRPGAQEAMPSRAEVDALD